MPTEIRILFTTQADINNSGVPGIKSWTTGDVLAIGDRYVTDRNEKSRAWAERTFVQGPI